MEEEVGNVSTETSSYMKISQFDACETSEASNQQKKGTKVSVSSFSPQPSGLFTRPASPIHNWQVYRIPRSMVRPQNMFFLRGEIFLDLNVQEHSRISNLNHYKHVRSVKYIKNSSVIYTDFHENTQVYDSHEHAINYLRTHTNSDVQEIADKLSAHQLELVRDTEAKKYILSILNSNPFIRSLVIQRHKEFLAYRDSIISSLPKDRYFCFSDYGFDYNQMQFQLTGIGMNEAYIRLIGCDTSSMQEIQMRKGILEFLEARSRWQLLNRFLNISKLNPFTKNLTHEGRMSIVTLDNIFIDAAFAATFSNSQSSDVITTFFHPQYKDTLFDRGFVVIEVLLTDFHIKQINSIRQKYIANPTDAFDQSYVPHLLEPPPTQTAEPFELPSNPPTLGPPIPSNSAKDLLSDIPYTVQSQYFIDKFYTQTDESEKSRIQDANPNKTCKFRYINQS